MKDNLDSIEKSPYYNNAFYDIQVPGSLKSARHYARRISEFFVPSSVIDFGCGRGTWLKAFHEIGSTKLLGLDGSWNNQLNMIEPSIQFKDIDFNSINTFCDTTKYDLAISCEVAEHFKPENSEAFIEAITNRSDIVIFGAAYPNQGGLHHINERKHSFWASLFGKFEFIPFDLFRPIIWGHKEVDYWYQQNTFLYVKLQHPLIRILEKKNIIPIMNSEFLNCVHPYLFDSFVSIRNRKLVQLAIKIEEDMSRHPRILRVLRQTRDFFLEGYDFLKTLLKLNIVKVKQ